MKSAILNGLISAITAVELCWLYIWGPLLFIASLIGMTPFKAIGNESSLELMAIKLRGAIAILIPSILVIIATLLALTIELSDKHTIGTLSLWLQQMLGESTWLIVLSMGGLAIRKIYFRWLVPKLSAMKKSATKEQKKDSLSDIEEESNKYKKMTYNPSNFYKKGRIFLGLDEHKKPISITWDEFKSRHKQVVGPTGFGKGVIYGMLADQLIRLHDNNTVFYVDPKDDEFMPRIMLQAAKNTGREFIYLSLNPDDVGSWGPFLGGKKTDARARFERAFGLESRGGDSDYYKKIERRTGLRAFESGRDIFSLLDYCKAENEDSSIAVELELWAENESLCATEGSGFSVADAILNKQIVYIKTDLDHAVMLRATTLLMLEIAQEGKRLKHDKEGQISGLFDEVSFYVTPEIAERLASIRNAGIDYSLAYQSHNDMRNLKDKNVNADYVFSSVNTNCQLKLFYGGGDYEQALKLEQDTGTVVREVEQTSATELNEAAAEVWKDQSFVMKKEVPFINKNTILSLPEGVCVLKETGKLARLCFTSFVPVKDMEVLNKYLDELRAKELEAVKNDSPTPPKPVLEIESSNPFLS